MIESNFTQDISALKKLPNSWSVIDFGEVFTDISGGNKKFLKSDFLVEGKVAVVDQGKDLIAGYTNEEDEVVKGQPPYIVFGDHTRIFKFIDFPFVMGADGTKVFKVKDITINDEKYLFHFLNSLNIPNTGYNRHFKYLKSTKIPLPPLPQQKKIANILDAADTLRQNDKALIAKYDELTQALFLDMFGDPVSNPKGWEKVELGNIAKKITDGEHQNPSISDTGKHLIMAKDVLDDKVDFSNPRFVSNEDFNKYISKCKPEYGDIVLVSRGATVGRCTVVSTDIPFCLMGSVILIKKGDSFNSEFVISLLKNKRFLTQLTNVSSASAQQAIYISHLKKLKITLPPLDLQNQFAERVAVIEEQKAIAQKSLEHSESLLNSLLQKAFKGEL
jgi:type I restriction enzyme S subunit